MQNEQMHHIERACPACGEGLDATGVFEVKTNVEEWTKWFWRGDIWDIRDTESDGGENCWLECGGCRQRLSDELSNDLWSEMNW